MSHILTQKMNEQIISGFNCLRAEQRQLSLKLSELESDSTEHKLVLDALNKADPQRKCFRMIGGVLVERSVKEIIPSLQKNGLGIQQLIESIKSQILLKGEEIRKYIEVNNIQIRVPIETTNK